MRKDKSVRFPLSLDILPGRRWTGKLSVLGRHSDGYSVAFDAEDPNSEHERYVYDRTILSAARLEEWTGWREPKGDL